MRRHTSVTSCVVAVDFVLFTCICIKSLFIQVSRSNKNVRLTWNSKVSSNSGSSWFWAAVRVLCSAQSAGTPCSSRTTYGSITSPLAPEPWGLGRLWALITCTGKHSSSCYIRIYSDVLSWNGNIPFLCGPIWLFKGCGSDPRNIFDSFYTFWWFFMHQFRVEMFLFMWKHQNIHNKNFVS